MKFKVIPYGGRPHHDTRNVVVLLTDGWDDWFKFSTMYNVFYYDQSGERHAIGEVKIGEFDMVLDQRRPNIPAEFEDIGDAFFCWGRTIATISL